MEAIQQVSRWLTIVLGLVVVSLGLIFGTGFINATFDDLDRLLNASITSLTALNDTLDETMIVLDEAIINLDSITVTLDGIADSIDQIEPIINTANDITVTQIPDSLDIVIEGVNGLSDTLIIVDGLLRRLSDVEIDLPGILPSITLGLLYRPERPIHEPVDDIGANLESIADTLRNLEKPMNDTVSNLSAISIDIEDISANAQILRTNILDTQPRITNFSNSIDELITQLEQPLINLNRNRTIAFIVLTLVLVWVATVSIHTYMTPRQNNSR